MHFEDNQFEKNRIDGWIKLKLDAIPTIFNVPNPPKSMMATRKSKYKVPMHFAKFIKFVFCISRIKNTK